MFSAPALVQRPDEPDPCGEAQTEVAFSWSFVARGVLAGVAAGVATYLLVTSGLLPELVLLLLVALLLVVVPSAPRLAPRLGVNLATCVGWVPLAWGVDWPVPVNRGAAVTALVTGGLVVHVLSSDRPRRRLGNLVPDAKLVDALLPLAAAAAAAATYPLTFAASPLRALTVLVPGADNWAHFDIFSTMRAHGPMSGTVGSTGETWAFADYPKGFHGLVATLSEVTFPGMTTGPQSLMVYTHTVGVVIVLGLVLVTAVFLSLPVVADRPGLAAPAVVVTWTALLWEPGQKVLANGFANFWLGAVAAGSALVLALAADAGVRQTVRVSAVAGLLVCVFYTWTPLGIIAAPAAFIVMVPQGAGSGPRHRRIWTLVVLGLSLAAVAKVVLVLVGVVSVGFVVAEVSGFDGTSPVPTLLLLLVLVYVLVSGRALVRERTGEALERATSRRLALLALVPILAVSSLSALLVLQVRELGTTSYYFLKYLIGFELILAILTPAVCAMLLARIAAPPRRRRLAATIAIGTTLLATQFFGHLSFDNALLLSSSDDGTAAVRAPDSRLAMSAGILAAAQGVSASHSWNRDYLPLGRGNAAEVFYPDAWYHALNANVTSRVLARFAVLRREVRTVAKAAPLVRTLLTGEPRLRIAVPERYVAALRAELDDDELARRVIPVAQAGP